MNQIGAYLSMFSSLSCTIVKGRHLSLFVWTEKKKATSVGFEPVHVGMILPRKIFFN
jgi:hypothetical protein